MEEEEKTNPSLSLVETKTCSAKTFSRLQLIEVRFYGGKKKRSRILRLINHQMSIDSEVRKNKSFRQQPLRPFLKNN